MNADLMNGFDTANFILQSRTDFTGLFVEESKRNIERIR